MSADKDRMDLGNLYPFLYGGDSDLDAVLAEVRRSTAEKAAEIVALRETCLEQLGSALEECARAMADAFARGGRLFVFGNGGSATDAHDVATIFLHPGEQRAPLPARALTADVAILTALANDVGFDVVFARQIAAMAREDDIAMGLSTSGNSDNVIAAFEEAARRGLLTIGIAGYEGGAMAASTAIDHLLVVPSSSVHRIQEAQTTIYHVLWELTHDALERTLRPS